MDELPASGTNLQNDDLQTVKQKYQIGNVSLDEALSAIMGEGRNTEIIKELLTYYLPIVVPGIPEKRKAELELSIKDLQKAQQSFDANASATGVGPIPKVDLSTMELKSAYAPLEFWKQPWKTHVENILRGYLNGEIGFEKSRHQYTSAGVPERDIGPAFTPPKLRSKPRSFLDKLWNQ